MESSMILQGVGAPCCFPGTGLEGTEEVECRREGYWWMGEGWGEVLLLGMRLGTHFLQMPCFNQLEDYRLSHMSTLGFAKRRWFFFHLNFQ